MADVIAQNRSRGARKRSPSAAATTTKVPDLVRELEDAVRAFPAQRGLEEAAAALAAAIREGLPRDAYAEPRRAGVSDADWQGYEAALQRGESAHPDDMEVLYTAAEVWDGGHRREVLVRHAKEAFPDDDDDNHWWLLEPLHDTEAAVAVEQEANDPTYHKATPTVLQQFAEEARDLIAEFARELQHEASDLTAKARQLEQLAAVVS